MITNHKNRKVDSKPVRVRKVRRFSHPIPTFRKFVGIIRRNNPLLINSAVIQTLVGLSIVFISVVGHIQPLWLASVMSITGSITMMFGAYLWYDMLHDKNDMDDLFKEAIRRVINSQN
ncbi:MAG TPA: hypothetical protein VJ991_01570 [Balneolales bacterium]|nr:hypothetical protein [Balneolales bacterium]